MEHFSIIYGNGNIEIFQSQEGYALERARKESKFDRGLTLWRLLEGRRVIKLEY